MTDGTNSGILLVLAAGIVSAALSVTPAFATVLIKDDYGGKEDYRARFQPIRHSKFANHYSRRAAAEFWGWGSLHGQKGKCSQPRATLTKRFRARYASSKRATQTHKQTCVSVPITMSCS